MGLFDIFRRRAKKEPASEAPASSEAAVDSSAAATPASEAPVAASSAAPVTATPDVETPDSAATETPDESSVAASEAPVATSAAAEEPAESAASSSDADVVATPAPDSVASEAQPVAEPIAPVTSEAPSEAEAVTEPVASEAPAAATEPTDEPASEASESVKTEEAETTSESVTSVKADEAEPEAVATEEPKETAAETTESASTEPAEQTDEQLYDKGLEKTRTTFGQRLNALLANFRHVDESFFDDLEETLIGADVGFDMAVKLSDELRDEVKLQNAKKSADVQNVVVEKLVEIYDAAGNDEESTALNMATDGPTVILFVGVNGVGKTTTIGKMANRYHQSGKKVLLAAADTFRAGATEQLDVWAKRADVDIVKGKPQSDPAAVVFDAVKKAKEEAYDILFVDTAGRLQNKVNLMNELEKMKRIITREIPSAPHAVLLVLDATTGQNALTQAKLFKESTAVTGIVLTKLDGTARGGIVLAIRNELHVPVKFIGLGEQISDLRPFDPNEFVYGLFKGLIDVKALDKKA